MGIILLSIFALTTFYETSLAIPGADDFLTYWYFMIPYSIMEGVMGGFIGWYLANLYIGRSKINKTGRVSENE